MSKGKSHSRGARFDILKNNARQATRKARTQARRQRPGKSYDKAAYDGTDREES